MIGKRSKQKKISHKADEGRSSSKMGVLTLFLLTTALLVICCSTNTEGVRLPVVPGQGGAVWPLKPVFPAPPTPSDECAFCIFVVETLDIVALLNTTIEATTNNVMKIC